MLFEKEALNDNFESIHESKFRHISEFSQNFFILQCFYILRKVHLFIRSYVIFNSDFLLVKL